MESIQIIKDNLSLINIDINEDKLNKLEKYANLLKKWNNSYNLVGKSTLAEIYSRHILDSLQLVQYINKIESKNKKILDFGAGAGMPSVMLAIILDDYNIVACERIGKKCQFLNQVRRELALDNFTVIQEDVININDLFDVITCRAVASITDILKLTDSIKQNEQAYLLPKGKNYLDEITEAKNNGYNFNYKLSKSIVSEESVILELKI
jgi:16S rRNA (guanine527-N7)-methyltransferase